MFQPYLAEYRYYALFEAQSDMHDIDRAKGLFRSVTASDEQEYEGHGVWRRSRALSATEDRDSYEDYREASAAEVELLRRRADARPASPVDPGERDEQEAVLVLLAARRRAEPVDGHYYFALFEELGDVVDLDRAHSLIRCPADGDGGWQTFLSEGEWLPGKEPRDEHSLPVGREDAGRVSRARETAAIRYFDLRFGNQHELVRRTGSADEAAGHPGWRPTDVLGRVRPGWRVDEVGKRWFDTHRHVDADSGRFTLR